MFQSLVPQGRCWDTPGLFYILFQPDCLSRASFSTLMSLFLWKCFSFWVTCPVVSVLPTTLPLLWAHTLEVADSRA